MISCGSLGESVRKNVVSGGRGRSAHAADHDHGLEIKALRVLHNIAEGARVEDPATVELIENVAF